MARPKVTLKTDEQTNGYTLSQNGRIEARLTFLRAASVETEMFDTASDAKRWIAARCRQLDREGVDTSREWLRTEITLLPALADGREPKP